MSPSNHMHRHVRVKLSKLCLFDFSGFKCNMMFAEISTRAGSWRMNMKRMSK